MTKIIEEVAHDLAQHAKKRQAVLTEWAKAVALLRTCAEFGLSARAAKKYVRPDMTVEKLRGILAER